jgi:hypothetical protein
MTIHEQEFEILDEYEPRFSPVSYTRQELIDEAQMLVDASTAAWLAKQPDHVFDGIMAATGDAIWGGAGYLASLIEAFQKARGAGELRLG